MFYFQGTRKPDFKNISSDIYADYWQHKGFQMRDKLMERENIFFNWIKNDSKVLSIGCGNSRLLYELKNKKKCQVSGIDIESMAIKGLNEQGIEAKVADVTHIDFDLANYYDQKFDYIITSEFLEHIAMPEKLIQKLKRHTKYFTISIPNSAFYRYRWGLMLKGRFFTQWAQHPAEHLRYWSHKDFINWLAALDLKIEKFQASNGFDFIYKFKNIWPNMFGHQICYLVKV